jgi:hypothetical protein
VDAAATVEAEAVSEADEVVIVVAVVVSPEVVDEVSFYFVELGLRKIKCLAIVGLCALQLLRRSSTVFESHVTDRWVTRSR